MQLNLILTTWLHVIDAQTQGRSPHRVCWREGVWGWVPGPPCSGPLCPMPPAGGGRSLAWPAPCGEQAEKTPEPPCIPGPERESAAARGPQPGGDLSLVGTWGCGVTTRVPPLGSRSGPGGHSSAGQPAPHSESHPSSTLGRQSWVRMGEGGRAGHLWPGSPPAPVSWPLGPAGQVLAPARRPLALEV